MDTEDMDAIHELGSGLTEKQNRSLDRKASRKRRSVKKLYIYGALSFGLLCLLQVTLNTSLRLLMHKEEEEATSAGTANPTAKLNVYDACGFTLDPNTVGRRLSVSEDEKTVTYDADQPPLPDHPERFTTWAQVLSRESLTDRCYWEVERRGEVEIAVAYRGIPRGGDESEFGGTTKSWALACSDDRYIARYNGSLTVMSLPPSGSHRVRVYVDRPAGTLSYYRVTPDVGGSSAPLIHIHTFNTTFNTYNISAQEELLLGFGVYFSGSSVTLRQSPARV